MDIELLSKGIYLLTIIALIVLWKKSLVSRSKSTILNTVFILYCVLTPLYSSMALEYVFDIDYHAYISYIGWAATNALFIVTNFILLNFIILGTVKNKENQSKIKTLEKEIEKLNNQNLKK